MSSEFTGMSTPPEADDAFREPPKWPKVVGIISIVLGSLGLVCNGFGAVSLAISPVMGKMVAEAAEQNPAAAVPPVMFQPSAMMVVASVLSVLASVVLLIAGISTVTRKPLGRTLHLLYPVPALISVVLSILATMTMVDAIQEWVRDNPDANFSQNYTPISSYFGVVIGVLLGGAYPIFALIWFGAMGKRPEVDAPEYL